MRRKKVPDDEDIDINKIAQGNRPKDDRNKANITAKQYKEKEAKRQVLEKVKRIQGQNDSKNICDAAQVWGGPRATEHTKEFLLPRRPGC